MSSSLAPQAPESYIVRESESPNVKFELVSKATGRTHPVVDFADELVEQKLGARGPGSHVTVDMVPLDEGADEWQVTRLLPGSPPMPDIGR